MLRRFGLLLINNWGSIVALIVLFLYCKFCVTATVFGSSMQPTYSNGDFLLCIRTDNVEYGDIVAIYSEELGRNLCKRVIGVAGDNVVISNSTLIINGGVIHEGYLKENIFSGGYNITVPDGKVFVLGDNRNDSLDSRMLGCLPVDAIVGKSIFNITKYTGLDKDSLCLVLAAVWLFLMLVSARRLRNEKQHSNRCSGDIGTSEERKEL